MESMSCFRNERTTAEVMDQSRVREKRKQDNMDTDDQNFNSLTDTALPVRKYKTFNKCI